MKDADTPINQRELAKCLGLSQATVSRALRGDRNIAAATRKRVFGAAEEYSYHPSPLLAARGARAHSGGRAMRGCPVAVIACKHAPDPDGFRKSVLKHYLPQAEKLGLQLTFFNVAGEKQSGRDFSNRLFLQGFQAIVFAYWRTRFEWLDNFDFSRFALVSTDPHFEARPMMTVRPQRGRSMSAAYRKAAERGWLRIGAVVFAHTPPLPDQAGFTAGFFKEQFLARGKPDPRLLHAVPLDSPPSERKAALEGWIQETKPEAIIAPTSDFYDFVKNTKMRHRPHVILLHRHSADQAPFEVDGFLDPWQDVGRLTMDAVESAVRLRRFGLLQHPVLMSVPPRWMPGARDTTPPGKPKKPNPA